MKNSLKIKSLVTALVITLGLTSCSKNEFDNTPVYISGISFIHTSPTTEKLDVYVDNTRASIEDFGFGTKMDYLNAYSGDRTITVTKKNDPTKLTSSLLKLEPEIGYSVFVIDKLEKINLLMLKDDLAKPITGQAKVRFVNLSPDSEALNLIIEGKTTAVTENKAFKEFSAFEAIDAAESVTFNIKNKATGALEATIANVKIEDGKIYTIYAKGLKATQDETKFGASIYTHK